MQNIISYETFITSDQCKELIRLCESLDGEVDRHPMLVQQYRVKFRNETLRMEFRNLLPNYEINNRFTYVKYDNGGCVPVHCDEYSEKVTHTALIYLNDDYGDGETYIVEDMCKKKINKKIGKIIIFKGNEIVHGCYPVIGTKNILLFGLIYLND